MMKPSEVDSLKKGEKPLGKGAFSTASLVQWQGLEAVLKRPRGDTSPREVYMEIDYLLELRGAGGAPLALGLCLRPFAQLITFEGELTLHQYLKEEHKDEELLSVATEILQCV